MKVGPFVPLLLIVLFGNSKTWGDSGESNRAPNTAPSVRSANTRKPLPRSILDFRLGQSMSEVEARGQTIGLTATLYKGSANERSYNLSGPTFGNIFISLTDGKVSHIAGVYEREVGTYSEIARKAWDKFGEPTQHDNLGNEKGGLSWVALWMDKTTVMAITPNYEYGFGFRAPYPRSLYKATLHVYERAAWEKMRAADDLKWKENAGKQKAEIFGGE